MKWMVLRTENLGYWYTTEYKFLFKNVNITFERGKLYSILGTSGSGKTTFLSLISGLDSPKQGEIYFEEQDIKKKGLRNYRKEDISIVFQAYNLLPYMSALDNVLTAMDISNSLQEDKRKFALENLAKVGINEELANEKVTKLSGGQQQRVAIIRALCCEHDVIVADEPTGNLDSETTQDIISIFKSIAHDNNKCIIMVTHEREIAAECDAVYELKDKEFSLLDGQKIK